MSNVVYSREQDGLRVEVCYDEDDTSYANPRQWTQLGTMACRHRSYRLGDIEAPAPDEFEIDGEQVSPVECPTHTSGTGRRSRQRHNGVSRTK